MKDELLRVLNNKLDDITKDINSLEELNGKIEKENEELVYVRRILKQFSENEEYDVLNFVKLSKTDFEHVLDITNNDSRNIFNTNGCNYEGLIYLINGIKSGVSLSLTDEQRSGIEYLIRGLSEKEEEKEAVIDGLQLVKSRFEVSDVDALKGEEKTYQTIIDKLNNEDYLSETDKISEAMKYSKLDDNDVIKILSFVLEYNYSVYKKNKFKPSFEEKKEEPVVNNISEYENEKEETKEEVVETPSNEYNFKPLDTTTIELEKEDVVVPPEEEETEEEKEISFEIPPYEEPKEDASYIEPISETSEEENKEELNVVENDNSFVPSFDINEDGHEEFGVNQNNEIVNEPSIENSGEMVEEAEEKNGQYEPLIDNDFKDVVSNEDYEEENKTSTRELQRLFAEYNLSDELNGNELLEGNVNNYRETLEILRENKILDDFVINKELFHEILLYSGKEEIDEVLKIIKNDLSVDEDDYKITLAIAINTIPTIFIKDGGSYDNFVRNTKLFKEMGINLVNLFDFSKEVFIVDNERIVNNYEIVKKYNVNIDYKNAKYYLVLPNIAERMDYYVESVYPDATKEDEVFDGINYINNYAVKLNNVCDLIIKRLRFASENKHRVFGSKPNSLTGEITNLKVNALDLGEDYLNKFFNNEFDGITFEETREFVKLIRNSSNVGNYADELSGLDKYRDSLRYVINGINVSYNKVIRNYNILRSYGIDARKALHFAVCYNLVITKEEYQSLKKVIDELGGNL